MRQALRPGPTKAGLQSGVLAGAFWRCLALQACGDVSPGAAAGDSVGFIYVSEAMLEEEEEKADEELDRPTWFFRFGSQWKPYCSQQQKFLEREGGDEERTFKSHEKQ